ncbi:MAG: ABC transporter ATP-binding protein, partial [Proteobacteria bacterium]|nr:ABC transporter ATP-binding protein [Pseudomonadota bacterium]
LLGWVGTGQILKGAITIGVLIGFINTLNRIFIPIREFAQQIALIQRALSALEHIHELQVQEPEERKLQTKSPQDREFKEFKKLEFKDVSFRYSATGPLVLNGISFVMNKGDRFAIVGATGSGKSTVMKVLTKSYEGYSGSIKINGIELTAIPKSQLSTAFSLMQQDVYLFNESINFNISLFRRDIGEIEVRNAAEYVFAKDFIEDFAGAYQYEIRDNGNNISAGQAQLISFARAIAGKSEMILMDEATASIDSVTEHLIQKAIERILQDKTVIAIAHRLSTVTNSDKILVLKDGVIVEQGNHNNLLQQQGYYLELLSKFEIDPKEKNSKVAS